MKRLKVIACEIAFRELCFCASQSRNIIDFSFMTKGLHDKGAEKMREALQEEIDQVDTQKYEAILLGYGLCSCGVVGLCSKLPLVIPKAHDCVTFFLGSKERYAEFFEGNTGSYIYSPGWIERDIAHADIEDSITTKLGMNKKYEEYVEEFGEENAQYLMEMFEGYKESYDKVVFINTLVGDVELYRQKLQEKAASNGWKAEEIAGNTSLLQKFLDADWNEEDFTVILPEHEIVATNDAQIIGSQKLSGRAESCCNCFEKI